MLHARSTFSHALLVVAHRYERGQLDPDVVSRLMRDIERLSKHMRDEQARRFLMRVWRALRAMGKDIVAGSPDPERRMRIAQAVRAMGQRMTNLRM